MLCCSGGAWPWWTGSERKQVLSKGNIWHTGRSPNNPCIWTGLAVPYPPKGGAFCEPHGAKLGLQNLPQKLLPHSSVQAS